MKKVHVNLREIFPVYPLTLRSRPKSKVKFGTRRLYVDLPWPVYHFMGWEAERSKNVDLTSSDVKRDWKEFLQQYKSFFIFNGKPLVSVSLRSDKFSGKKFLVLIIRWNLFVEYLENKAKNILFDVKKDGRNVLKLYKEIWLNYFNIPNKMIPPQPTYFPSERERFDEVMMEEGYPSRAEALRQYMRRVVAERRRR